MGKKKSKNCYEFYSGKEYLFRGDWTPLAQPDTPTDTEPGTPERMEVFRQRLEAGLDMWHPDDYRRPVSRLEGRAVLQALGVLGDDWSGDDLRLRSSSGPSMYVVSRN